MGWKKKKGKYQWYVNGMEKKKEKYVNYWKRYELTLKVFFLSEACIMPAPMRSPCIGDDVEWQSSKLRSLKLLGRLLCDLIPSFLVLFFDLKKGWACL